MALTEDQIRVAICEIGRRLYAKNMVAANDGNISYRFSDDRILTTPTGVCKGEMQPEMLVMVDLRGHPLGPGRPSSELPMHLFIYQHRRDVSAVVHAHPPHATAFATAGISLQECVAPEIITTLGSIPLAPYGTPSTPELPESLRPFVSRYDAILLANHGAVTLGKDPWEAYFKMERLEHYARIIFLARQLNGEKPLTKQDVEKLARVRQVYGLSGEAPGCVIPGSNNAPTSIDSQIEIEQIIQTLVQEAKAHFK
ncbi:MAG: class II aldolase/adducin family protein [Calditrichaeota bacterium]|nr:MAG: class II aldolase/adducin family protein [Calditrichota bacterium]